MMGRSDQRDEDGAMEALIPLLSHSGRTYLGMRVPKELVSPFLNQLRSLLPHHDYTVFTTNQQLRDDGNYHLTIIDPREYEQLILPVTLAEGLDGRLRFRIIGLGQQASGGNVAYYCVVDSTDAQLFRRGCGLGSKDLHITLGFNPKDIHDQAKGPDTLIED